MQPLMLHRSCDLGPIRAVTAQVSPTPAGIVARFRLEGRVDAIRLPSRAPSVRTDELWKSTCLEVFWQPIGGAGYREINLSPSGQWAAYEFDGYRDGMRVLAVDAINLTPVIEQDALSLEAEIVADFPSPAQVGLNAVVENGDGALQYWALAFGPGKPDFHSEACRQLIVER